MSLLFLGICIFMFSSSSAVETSSLPYVPPWPFDESSEQQLCSMLVEKYNTFADMVPLIVPIEFPPKNDYFTGDAQVLFYPAVGNGTACKCKLFKDKGIKVLRIDVSLRMDILNKGRRMDIEQCRLEAHLRLDHPADRLVVKPQLVDVQLTGEVFQDGVLLERTQVREILRPILVKGFSSLANQALSYSGDTSSAVFVDPAHASALLKQVFLSYMSQL